MAVSGTVTILYIIDILYYTVVDGRWGIWEAEFAELVTNILIIPHVMSCLDFTRFVYTMIRY